MRLGQGNQVSNGPGDHVAISLQVAFAPLLGSEDPGNVTRNRRLFRQNGDGTGFICLHRDSQSTAIPVEKAAEGLHCNKSSGCPISPISCGGL